MIEQSNDGNENPRKGHENNQQQNAEYYTLEGGRHSRKEISRKNKTKPSGHIEECAV